MESQSSQNHQSTQQRKDKQIKHNDLITVVVPTYQSVAYVKETLQSIQTQTHTNLEIFVVDDGSQDDTVTYIGQMAKEDSRIQVIPLVHQGAPGHCRNAGLENAKADYLIYFDSDDSMYPTMLETMLQVMKEKEVDVVIGNPRYVDMASREPLSSQMEWFFAKETHDRQELFQINPFPCNKLYKTKFLRESKVTYLEGVFNQDLGYFLSLLFHHPSFAIVTAYVMDYMVRQGSITTSKHTRKKHIDIIAVFDQVFQEWEKTGNDPQFTYGVYHMFIRSMIFKASFFDLLQETNDIDRIRDNLIRHCPNWYQRQEFKDYFPWKKRVYNRLILQYRCYFLVGKYKAWKTKQKSK